MTKTYLTCPFSFESAHKLPDYLGDCANLHGHTYFGKVVISGEVGINGMVMDFKQLKTMVKEVIKEYDHKYLNDLFKNPTAEIIAKGIFLDLDEVLCIFTKVVLEEVSLHETQDSEVIVRRVK